MTEDLEEKVANLEKRVSALEEAFDTGPIPSEEKKRDTSVNEFLREKGVTNTTSAVNIVLAIAVFNDRFRGADSFSASDLSDLIREARQKPPTNINDCINRNISKGYMAVDKRGGNRKKRWYVTNTGRDFVDDNLNANGRNH